MPATARMSGAGDLPPALFARSGIYEAFADKLVYVVVVAVLDAGIDAPGPHSPLAVAHPPLGEARHLTPSANGP
jgi:hypothetical protein